MAYVYTELQGQNTCTMHLTVSSFIHFAVTLSNIQIALQGLEKTGYILVSSHIAQVFGREHEPQLNEGDLVTKKSWVAKVQELQVCSLSHSHSHSLSLSLPLPPPSLPLSLSLFFCFLPQFLVCMYIIILSALDKYTHCCSISPLLVPLLS